MLHDAPMTHFKLQASNRQQAIDAKIFASKSKISELHLFGLAHQGRIALVVTFLDQTCSA